MENQEKIEQLEKRVERLKAENRKLKEKYQSLLDTTFKNAQKMSPNGLRESLINQMGKKAYLKKLLTERRGSLWTADRLLLLEMVEGKIDKEEVKAKEAEALPSEKEQDAPEA